MRMVEFLVVFNGFLLYAMLDSHLLGFRVGYSSLEGISIDLAAQISKILEKYLLKVVFLQLQ
jgi:hypothetical protein